MKSFASIAGVFTALACSACAGVAAPPPLELTRTAVYRLAPDDKVKVTVYGEEDLSGQYLVGSDGSLSFPLIGMVRAGGLTLTQLQQVLTSRLGARFLKHPRVSADIVEYRPFYILGEVNHAGQYSYRVGITVTAAVATAGGFTYRANKSTVAIKHFGEPGEHKLRLTADLQVSPGDTVRVLERFF